jgi:hypothetical protein
VILRKAHVAESHSVKPGPGTRGANEGGINLRDLVLDGAGDLGLSGRTQRGEQSVTIGEMTVSRVGSNTCTAGHLTYGDCVRTVLTSEFKPRLNEGLTQVAMVIGVACANRHFIHEKTLCVLYRLIRSGNHFIRLKYLLKNEESLYPDP